MDLNRIELLTLLLEKEVNYLYHANTVATTITFIQQGGLLSREFVVSNGLYQTPQDSDEKDIEYDMFDDLFLDTTDLHTYFGRQNHYGPVTFKFNAELLLAENVNVWVTKNNPMFWNSNLTAEQKYFQSIDELRADWG